MEIQHKDDLKKGAFTAESDGKQAGEMTYTWAGEAKFIIDHTEVDPTFSGQGVGVRLVEASVLFARKKGVKIMPLCPFAKKMLERHSEWQDVLF
jgi:predicted GNAT family acetyltransferase